jgi:hypothetical protein
MHARLVNAFSEVHTSSHDPLKTELWAGWTGWHPELVAMGAQYAWSMLFVRLRLSNLLLLAVLILLKKIYF